MLEKGKDGKTSEVVGSSAPLRTLILHLHDRRIRIGPPENSRARKNIQDLEFYMKRLNLVEALIHLQYAPPKPVEVDHISGQRGTSTKHTGAIGAAGSKLRGSDDEVEIDYIGGDKFGKETIITRKEFTIKSGLGLQVTEMGDGNNFPKIDGSSMQTKNDDLRNRKGAFAGLTD